MKMMLGAFSLASLNSSLTSFSLSPSHLDTRSLLLMLKKVLSASVATAWQQWQTRQQRTRQQQEWQTSTVRSAPLYSQRA